MATTDHDHNGKINTAVTLGAIGTALGGLQVLQNGGLGFGLFGGNNAMNAMNQNMTHAGMMYTDQLQSQIAELKAEKYSNRVGIDVYKASAEMSNKNDDKILANLKDAFKEQVAVRERLSASDVEMKYLRGDVNELKMKTAVHEKEIADLKCHSRATTDAVNALANNMRDRFGAVYGAIEASKNEAKCAVELEAERRANADRGIYCYVDSKFVAGRLVMPKDSICPPVMPRYNTWEAPTDTAPATQPVTGTINVNNI